MHIRKINSISRIMFTIMIFISTLSIIVVGFLWGVSEYGKFEKESEHLKKEYIERQKHLIKTEVQRAVEQVNCSGSHS